MDTKEGRVDESVVESRAITGVAPSGSRAEG